MLSLEGELAAVNPYRLANAAYDNETGLYYVGAKYYYDADMGRYISKVKGAVTAHTPIEANGYIFHGGLAGMGDPGGTGDPCPTWPRKIILVERCPFHNCPYCPWVPDPWEPHDPDDPWYRVGDLRELILEQKNWDILNGQTNLPDHSEVMGITTDLRPALAQFGNIGSALDMLNFKDALDGGKNVEFASRIWK